MLKVKYKNLQKQLEKHFGFPSFRGYQEKIVANVLESKNTMVIMPTGVGKSICFQLPAVMQDGLALVISPLIALMKNQVDFLDTKSISSAFLNSSLSQKQVKAVKGKLLNNKLKLLYLAPETLNKESTVELLKKISLSFVAIDEAHCISDWGNEFRPEYRKIKATVQRLGNLPIMVLTATATPRVQRDILKTLSLQNACIFKSSFERKNLYYEIRPKKDCERQILTYIKSGPKRAGIIYCHSRKKVEELAKILINNNIPAAAYHAGIDVKRRAAIQDEFLQGKVDVMVATIAFGMGIDKPDVRFIIHYDVPKSLENYYQETGRAGRDGKESTCVLFFSLKDIQKLENFNKNKLLSEKKSANTLLHEIKSYVLSGVCRTRQILHYFGETYPDTCQNCDNCIYPTQMYEGTPYLLTLLETIERTETSCDIHELASFIANIETPHIRIHGYHQLKLFGIGKAHSFNFWISVIRQAEFAEFIKKETDYIEVLNITPKGRAFMAKPHAVSLTKTRDYDTYQPVTIPMCNSSLLEQFTTLQKNIEEKIAPDARFSQLALESIATFLPTTIAQLERLPYITSAVAKSIGKPFVLLVAAHQQRTQKGMPQNSMANPQEKSKKAVLLDHIARKLPLEEIARLHKTSCERLIEEFEAMAKAGIFVQVKHYLSSTLPQEEQKELAEYFNTSSTAEMLDGALDEFDSVYSEQEIHLSYIMHLSDSIAFRR